MSTDPADIRKFDNDGNPLVGNAGAVAIQQRILTAHTTKENPGE